MFRGRVIANDIAANFASFSCCKTTEPPVDSLDKNCVADFECPPGWVCVGGVVPSDDPVTALAAGNCRKPCPNGNADCTNGDSTNGDTCDGTY